MRITHGLRRAAGRLMLLAVTAVTMTAPPVLPPEPARAEETHEPDAPPRLVTITAKRFEFIPKEITLKQGEPVLLRLTTEDVTHGFFMRALGIDTVIEPGHPTEITLVPQKTGRFITICDHFCGAGHGNMNMTITVE